MPRSAKSFIGPEDHLVEVKHYPSGESLASRIPEPDTIGYIVVGLAVVVLPGGIAYQHMKQTEKKTTVYSINEGIWRHADSTRKSVGGSTEEQAAQLLQAATKYPKLSKAEGSNNVGVEKDSHCEKVDSFAKTSDLRRV